VNKLSDNDLARGGEPTNPHQPQPIPKTLKLTGDPERRELLRKFIENFLGHNPKKRQDGVWPYLLIRAFPNDFGVRQPPLSVFWESPDLLVVQGDVQTLEGNTPTLRPIPNKPHTIFIRVWNLGRLPAVGIRLRVFWANPSFSFDDPTGPGNPHYIGGTYINLASRYQPNSHAVVRLPVLWEPVVENNGHECLLAKVDSFADRTGPGFDANIDRHVGQRNLFLAEEQDNLAPILDSLNLSRNSSSDVQLMSGTSEQPHITDIKSSLIEREKSLSKAVTIVLGITDLSTKSVFSQLNTKALKIISVFNRNILGGYTIIT
jgi:hypothetical protein